MLEPKGGRRQGGDRRLGFVSAAGITKPAQAGLPSLRRAETTSHPHDSVAAAPFRGLTQTPNLEKRRGDRPKRPITSSDVAKVGGSG